MAGRLCFVFVLTMLLIPVTIPLKTVTLKQLEQVVSKTEFVIVIFHSSFTEQTKDMSKRAVDELDRVSGALTEGNNRIKFFSVSLDQHPEAMAEFKLNDVPSIVIFRDKYPRVYYGQRMGYTLFSFFQELLTNDPIKIIQSKQQKKQFSFDDQTVRVITYFPKDSPSPSLEVFKMAAKHYQGEITFGLIQDEKMAKSFKLKAEGETAMMKPGERPLHVTTKFLLRDELVGWVEENKKPLWGVLTFNNIYSVWQGVKTTFVLFLRNMEEHYSKTVLSIFKTLAKQYGPTHDLEFVIVDAGVYKDFVNGIGLTEDDLPTFAIFHPRKRQEYFFPKDKQALSIKNAKRWLDLFLAGKLDQKTFYDDTDGVVTVNDINFEEIVLDTTKDVLLEFYAPWCGHCEALAPKYKQVAMYMQLFPSIKVAAFDAQAHKVPKNYNITGLPTLLFFPANDKTPLSFETGPHDADGIIDFIKNHQSTLSEEEVENFKKYWDSLKKLRDEQQPKPEEGEQQQSSLEIEEEQQEEQEQVGEIENNEI